MERNRVLSFGAVIAAVVLTAVTFGLRLRALSATPEPTGIDGYWYLVQVRSIVEHGHLVYRSAPLVPWLMAAVALASTPATAVKIVAAAGSAAMILPAFFVARGICGRPLPALAGAATVATSAQSFYLATEFVKQSVGLTLAMTFAAALAAALARPSKLRIALAVLALAACGLAHPTSLGLAILLAAPPLAARWRLAWVPAVLVTVFALLRYHPLRTTPDFSFAVSALPGVSPFQLGHEVAIAAALDVAVIAFGPRRVPAAAVGFLGFALLVALPWIDIADDQGLGYRLRLCAFTTLPISTALLLARIRRDEIAAALVGVLVLLRPFSRDEGVVRPHPALVAGVARLADILPPGARIVVPERHVAFMAAWFARADVHLRPISDPEGFRLLPGAEIRPGLWKALEELRAHPVDGVAPTWDLHALHPNGLVLLRELTFSYVVDKLPDDERRLYQSWPVQ